jgi:integrase
VRGHVAKKGNRYYAVIYEGIDAKTGRQRHRWYAGGATRKEAEKLLAELVKRNHDGDYRAPDRITLGEYLEERWIPMKRSQIKFSTWDQYRRNTRIHVVPRIGHIPLQKLTPEDLDSFYAELLVDGKRNGAGGGLAPRTVRIIHNMLHKAFADATRKGTMLRNIADMADPPRASASPPKEMRIWTPEQLRQFLAEIEHHRLFPAYYLSANTGMRRGEVLGLQWDDVDLERARLSVRHQIVDVAYELIVEDLKTTTGRRTVDLDPRTLAVLRAWRKTQIEERIEVGERPTHDELVFPKPDGTPTHPDYFSQVFDRHLAKSSLPRIRLHDLRHTHASILLRAGVPVKVVSERLGHASPAFTMTVYQHLLPGMQADAAATFGDVVFGIQ